MQHMWGYDHMVVWLHKFGARDSGWNNWEHREEKRCTVRHFFEKTTL